MDFEALAHLSWRDALIAISVVLAFYVVVLYLRIRRLQREAMASSAAAAGVAEKLAAKSAFAAYTAMQEPELPTAAAAPAAPAAPEAQAEPAFAWNEPPPPAPQETPLSMLERDLAQLRKEVGALRAEVLMLREEQRRDLVQARVTQNVSPLYSDAMQMAMRGHDAASISQHCGIARAEAELVAALVRNRDAQGNHDGQDSLDLR